MNRVKSHINELNLDSCPICHAKEVTVPSKATRVSEGSDKWVIYTICHSCGETTPQTISSEVRVALLRPEGILQAKAIVAQREIEGEIAKQEQDNKKDMEKWVDDFITALSKDHIQPSDF